MISYSPFYRTLKSGGVTEYHLVNKYSFSPNIFYRMRHGKNISTKTINSLCEILNCNVSDIIEYISEK